MSPRIARLILLALIGAEVALWLLGPQPKDHLPDIAAATAAGKKPDWWDDAAMGLHYGAAIGAGLLVLLLGTAQWWARKTSDSGVRDSEFEKATAPDAGRILTPRYFWPLLIGAALLCVNLRVPLASKSLWWDEAWVIQQVSFGRWKADTKQPEKMKFQAHDWSRCAWYYQKPTNHAPMSLLQKASIKLWQNLTRAKKEQFNDLAARVPALAASGLAVMLLGLLLRAWGAPGAGITAAFVLAVHPWHIRYGVDARAYALVVPLCVAGMLAITRLVQTRGEKILPWLGWGTAEFLWLWAYPNAVLDVTTLNIVAGVLLWRNCENGRARWTSLYRLAATNVLAAACLIQMFLPNLIQARHWVGQERDKHFLDLELAASTLSQLFLGREYQITGNQASGLPQLVPSTFPPAAAWVFVALGLGVLFWLIYELTKTPGLRRRGVLSLPALLISGIAFALLTWCLGSYFYPRFVIALLPVTIAAICWVVGHLRMRMQAGVLVATICGMSYLGALGPYLTRPYEPLHEVATFVEQESDQNAKPPLVACYGLGREVLPVYYPSAIPVEDVAGVARVMQDAKAQRRALYLIYGYNGFNRAALPTGFRLMDDRAQFNELRVFPGIESEFYFHVLLAR